MMQVSGREMTAAEVKDWCHQFGYEFKSWDGTFCHYRDPQRTGTLHEFGVESRFWIESSLPSHKRSGE